MAKKSMSIERVLAEPIKLRALLAALDFSDEEVVDASKIQPKLFLEATRLRVKKMRYHTQLKSSLAVLRSERAAKVRSRSKEVGERATEGQVQEKINRDPRVIELEAAVTVAAAEEEFAKLLLEAFRMRRDALKVVADVIGAEVYVAKMSSGQTTELRNIKDKLEKKYPGRYSPHGGFDE